MKHNEGTKGQAGQSKWGASMQRWSSLRWVGTIPTLAQAKRWCHAHPRTEPVCPPIFPSLPQEQGLDTVDANRALGLPDDCREYSSVRNMLEDLGVKSVRLIVRGKGW